MVSVPLHLGKCITYTLQVSICKVWEKTCQSTYRNLDINDGKDLVFFRVFLSTCIHIHLYLYLQLRSSQPAVRGVHVEGGQFVARDWSNLPPT